MGEPPKRKRRVEEGSSSKELDITPAAASAWNRPSVNLSYESSDEDEVDPVLEKEYYRQIRESDGFDVDCTIPNSSVTVIRCADSDLFREFVAFCARIGLHWYNFHKGSNLLLSRVEKYIMALCGFDYCITLEAKDPANDSSFTFQTSASRASCSKNGDLCIKLEGCRIKPQRPGTGEKIYRWEYNDGIDEIYKGKLEWHSDDALMPSSDIHHQFYEVQDSDIRENDWLNMYAEVALYSLWERNMRMLNISSPALEIKKVVVQTYEDVKSKEKLKAGNAIFYISFSNLNDATGLFQDHRAIVRRTADGLPGHVSLEFMCWLE